MLNDLTRKIVFLIILAVGWSQPASCIDKSGNYLWPLPASQELTSGFCQWRSGHYHSGIDVRTFGKTGYKAVAITDGYVERIATNWYGYGKALYLKLDDGHIAVYGHLLKFTPEIDKYVQEQQIALKRYKTDLYPLPGRFKFSAGDLVAYTGQSGVGAPHLHFEIRTGEHEPLSPLSFYPELRDDRAPEIRSISLRPLDPVVGRAGDSPSVRTIRLQSESGRYVAKDTVAIYGPIGVEIDCYDRRNATKRKFSVTRIEMLVGEPPEMFFVTDYDTISFDRWSEVNLELNYGRSVEDDKFTHNLYLLPGAEPPISNKLSKNRGVISYCDPTCADGVTKLSFNIYDQSGNVSIAELHVDIRCHPPILALYADDTCGAVLDTNGWSYEVAIPDSANQRFDSLISGAEAADFVRYIDGDIELMGRFRHLAGKMLLLSAFSTDGIRFDCLIRLSETGIPLFQPDQAVDQSILRGPRPISSYDAVVVDVEKLDSFWRQRSRIARSTFFGLPVVFNESDSSISISPVYVSVDTSLKIDAGGSFVAGGNSDVTVEFPGGSLGIDSNSLYSESAMYVDTLTIRTSDHGQIPVYEIGPRDILLRSPMTLELTMPSGADTSRSHIYSLNSNDNPRFAGGDVTDMVVSTEISKLGRCAVLTDTIAPRISRVSPGNGAAVTKKRPKIRFKLTDDLSGIADDTYVVITVDGVWAIPEYDTESKWMITYPSQSLDLGEHTIRIEVRDRAGNMSIHESKFRRVRKGG